MVSGQGCTKEWKMQKELLGLEGPRENDWGTEVNLGALALGGGSQGLTQIEELERHSSERHMLLLGKQKKTRR